jgi:hypothetical protein
MVKLLLILLLIPSVVYGAEFSIPSARTVDWTLVGASEWYPTTRTTACDHTTYGTSLSVAECNGDSDCGPEIEAMLSWCATNSPNSVVMLETGTYPIETQIDFNEINDISLRGQGSSNTILTAGTGLGNYVFYFEDDDWFFTGNADVPISSGNSKGSTTITTSSAHGLSSGDYVLVDQTNEANWDAGSCTWCDRGSGSRLKGQVVKVTSIGSSTEFTFTPPLYDTYDTAEDASVVLQADYNENISIESLKIDNSSHNTGRPIASYGLYNAVFYDIEIDGLEYSSASASFYMRATSFVTFRNIYVHDAESQQTDNGYGICLGYACSNNLIENNIFKGMVIGPVIEGNGSGNVIAYNYCTDMYDVNSSGYNPYHIMIHGGGANMNLWEGNYIDEGKQRMDNWFGSAHQSTIFRTRIKQDETVVTPESKHCIDIEMYNYNSNLVGNILGTDGWETVYECETSVNNCAISTKSIYRIGYDAMFDNDVTDTSTRSTMLRHANFDYVNDATLNCDNALEPGCQSATNTSYPTDTLPNSYYLSSEPSWWGDQGSGRPWPSIGPDVSGYVIDIPAKDRYEGETYVSGTINGVSLTGVSVQ